MADNNDISGIISDENYYIYTVLYGGKAEEKIYYDNGDITLVIINETYAMAVIKNTVTKDIGNTNIIASIINKAVEGNGIIIYYVAPPEIFTLQETSAIDASEVNSVQLNLPLDLKGTGVTVAIIDTGIDYLNEEFCDINGKTRIKFLWDQTLKPAKGENVSFGRVYNSEEINRAIEAKKNNLNPYDIVPSIDKDGHGTNMAGIVGARGVNPTIRGMTPECDFLIIKLAQANSYNNFFPTNVNKYNVAFIISALEYAKDYALTQNKPTVILLPLGTNNGNHKGKHILDSFIQSISQNVGIVVVSGSGNEGIQDSHVSGLLEKKGDTDSIELIIAPNQKNMLIEIWVDLPNIIDVEIISPSGETTGLIPAILNLNKKYVFTFELTDISVYYYLPEEYTGDELIRIYLRNLQEGIWRIRVTLKLGDRATYNAWILQKGLTVPGTRFTSSDSYGTIMIPSDSPAVITAAAYNQNNNNLLAYSGVSFRNQYINNIDFAAGGVNTSTVGLNNKVDIINGTSLSAAVGAGACCLLFQWGIVNKNYPYMYAQSMKTFLSRGTLERRGDVYPNPQWGFGILNIYKLFENI
ncbi:MULTISPECIES: S8 family peptidase [Clostridium]|uniref:Peptidase S8 n=1 Tax=Clostridium cadaveris TaxID=1529 RepID=A0A1I2L1N0_9CLOT|nr:S8 family peptidase [Clostridium cadaveris]MDU4951021.1 S8 family peptidase [Clostridium sp.]MDM8312419.1 S8 family peptidase [Clostridium cadaveris]NME65012.1 S8 family peptidase [Clostridium cadaveris]NWK11202.1 S8 family peptidase [Clostridium cadaveris]PWL53375.1 MAG: peptidase S8 [Clostridium cadaveris]